MKWEVWQLKKLFRSITKRLIEKTPEERQLPDYAVDDETLNWDVLPFNEDAATEGLPEAVVPDYGLPEKILFPEEDILPEKALLPDSDDETLPEEKQGPLTGPSTSASPPPYSPPTYSPLPAYSKGRKKNPEGVDLSTLKKFLKNNKKFFKVFRLEKAQEKRSFQNLR